MSVVRVLCLITFVIVQTFAYNNKRFVLKYPSQYEEDDGELRRTLLRQYHSAQTKRSAPIDKYDVKDSTNNGNKHLYYNRPISKAPLSHYEIERNTLKPSRQPFNEHLRNADYELENIYDYSDEQLAIKGGAQIQNIDAENQDKKDDHDSYRKLEFVNLPQYNFVRRLNASKECNELSPNNELITFADPADNRYYYMCESRSVALRMPCPPFTVYSKLYNSCLTSNEDTSPCKGCLNGGDCVITESGYECKCAYNYEGEHCENHIKRCEPNPCAEGGRCYEISTAPGYICECADKIFDTCCCHDIENKCAHLPRRFYSEKGRMFIHCSRDGYAFVKFCPPGMVFNDYRQTCTFKTKWQDEDFKTVQNPDFYKQTDNEEYYDRSRDRDQQPPYIFNQSAPHAFY